MPLGELLQQRRFTHLPWRFCAKIDPQSRCGKGESCGGRFACLKTDDGGSITCWRCGVTRDPKIPTTGSRSNDHLRREPFAKGTAQAQREGVFVVRGVRTPPWIFPKIQQFHGLFSFFHALAQRRWCSLLLHRHCLHLRCRWQYT